MFNLNSTSKIEECVPITELNLTTLWKKFYFEDAGNSHIRSLFDRLFGYTETDYRNYESDQIRTDRSLRVLNDENNSLTTALHNIHRFTHCPHTGGIEAFDAVDNELQINSKTKTIYLKVKHLITGEESGHKQKLSELIKANIDLINAHHPMEHVSLSNEIKIISQRFNFLVQNAFEHDLTPENRLIRKLAFFPRLIHHQSSFKIETAKIKAEPIENIPPNLHPHIHERTYRPPAVYYNSGDMAIDHTQEARRIFLQTQVERLKSLAGRIIDTVAGIFNYKTRLFQSCHYFHTSIAQENIYADDIPPIDIPHCNSYWIGHATCLINVPIVTNQGHQINIQIITDPVENHLSNLFYPRMTRPGRHVEKCPAPHICLLSHNHWDHFDPKTLKKLLKFQPVIIAPRGDGSKFRSLGFHHVYEHGWWDKIHIPIQVGDDDHAEIYLSTVPTRHWSGQWILDAHISHFLGFVIHTQQGDIYFAGDTARLSEEHLDKMREFNIVSMFQPGGPDECRAEMQSTHQSTADALWMHFHLLLEELYHKGFYLNQTREKFIEDTSLRRTVFMHTKAYKLGNVHFNDTDQSIKNILDALQTGRTACLKPHEIAVLQELLLIANRFNFNNGLKLTPHCLHQIIVNSVILPKIGSNTALTDVSS